MQRSARIFLLLVASVCSAAALETARPLAFAATVRNLLSSVTRRSAASCGVSHMSSVSPVASQIEGADAHWENFITGTWGDFHGRFCRYDPTSSDLMVETHLLRSYHLHGQGKDTFLRQDNQIFFDDERGTVARGPWDVTKATCSTECGIVHPRVGKDETGTTFVVTNGPARATAWAVHQLSKIEPLMSPGVVPLGKGHEGQGYMVEMILSHGQHVRLSVGFVYDDVTAALQHVSFNREDNSGWPSSYWGSETGMQAVSAQDIESLVGITSADVVRGDGCQIEIPVKSQTVPLLQQLQLRDISWSDHLRSRFQSNTVVFKLPDGVVVIAPKAIPFGEKWGASYLWKPADADKVHSVETRYTESGAFDCFRHLEFAL